jgi:parallel beta-helix repeat protein
MPLSTMKKIRNSGQVFIILIGFLFLLSFAPSVFAATYYVDATLGNDANTGLSEATAWKTIAKVNVSTFNPGDQVLFRKGQTWREELIVPSSGTSGQPITFGAYGSGEKPIINGSDLLSSSGWAQYTGNIWRKTLPTKPKIVFFDGAIGTLKGSIGAVSGSNQWYWASNTLYVYSTSNPGTAFTIPGIEAAHRDDVVSNNAKSYITIDGLELVGTNSNVLWIGNAGGSHMTIQNCTIGKAYGYGVGIFDPYGGSNLISNNIIHDMVGNGVDGQGNGVNSNSQGSRSGTETVISSNTIYNCTGFPIALSSNYYIVEDNIIHDNGDNTVPGNDTIAIGLYGGAGFPNGAGQYNIIRRNLIYNQKSCSVDGGAIEVDLWCDYNQVYDNIAYGNDGPGLTIFGGASNTAYNNTFYDNSKNSCGELTAPGEIRITGSATRVSSNNVVKNNICYSTGTSVPAIYVDSYSYNKSNTIANNDLYAPNSSNFYYWKTSGGNSLSTFNALTGVSANLNADPLFVSASTHDFHLQRASPCISAGTNVGLTQDYQGSIIPQGSAPDIGAYQYDAARSLQPPTGIRIVTP